MKKPGRTALGKGMMIRKCNSSISLDVGLNGALVQKEIMKSQKGYPKYFDAFTIQYKVIWRGVLSILVLLLMYWFFLGTFFIRLIERKFNVALLLYDYSGYVITIFIALPLTIYHIVISLWGNVILPMYEVFIIKDIICVETQLIYALDDYQGRYYPWLHGTMIKLHGEIGEYYYPFKCSKQLRQEYSPFVKRSIVRVVILRKSLLVLSIEVIQPESNSQLT